MPQVLETVDAPSNSSTPYALPTGDSFVGSIATTGDVDWARLSLLSDYGYYLVMTGDGSANQLDDRRLQFWNDSGSLITSNAGTGSVVVAVNTTSAGTFFADMSGRFSSTGGYSVTLRQEIASHAGTRETLALNSEFTSAIDYAGDSDWAEFSAEANYGYYLVMTGDGSRNQLDDRRLQLWNKEGSLITSNAGTGSVVVAINTTSEGTFFADMSGRFSSTGGYGVTLRQEIASHAGTRETLALNSEFTSAIDYAGDSDWAEFSAEANYGYYLVMTGDGSGNQLDDRRLQLWNEEGSLITSNAGTGSVVVAINTTSAGTFFADMSGRFSSTGGYRVTLQREIAAHAGTRADLSVGGTLDSRMDYGNDQDWVRLNLVAGQIVTLELAGRGATPIGSREIYVRSEDGTTLASRFSNGATISFQFTAQTTGVHFLDVRSSSSGDYRLRMLPVAIEGGNNSDTLDGGDAPDLIYGFAAGDLLRGGLGSDTIFGGDANDTIYGGAQGDLIHGEEGNDLLYGDSSSDTIYGGNGNDTIDAGSSADTVYGGDGIDSILGGSSGDLLYGGDDNDTIRGGTSNDTVYGGANRDLIEGDDGNDRLFGGSSSDTINGGSGDDVIDAGSSADTVRGNDGDDSVLGGSSADLIYGDDDNDTIRGGTSDDAVYGGSHEDRIYGDSGNDSLYGDGSSDTIYGGDGTDLIDGGSSADRLYGGSSSDTIVGGSNNDTIYGGGSSDRATGGTGADVFVFNSGIGTSIDTITDFTVVDDTIWLEDTVFAGLTPGALAASAFVANTSGLATSAAHRVIYESDTGALFFDQDGTGANARIQFATLAPGLALTAADFLVI